MDGSVWGDALKKQQVVGGLSLIAICLGEFPGKNEDHPLLGPNPFNLHSIGEGALHH